MRRLLAFVLTASACAAHPDPEADDPGDAEHDAFLGKNDGGSCLEPDGAIAEGVLALVNDPTVTADELDASTEDGGAGLNRSAAYNIVDARPIADLGALDAVPWVGPTSCAALAAYACNVADRCHQEVTAMTWNLETFPLTAQTEEAVVEVFQQIQRFFVRARPHDFPGQGDKKFLQDLGAHAQPVCVHQLGQEPLRHVLLLGRAPLECVYQHVGINEAERMFSGHKAGRGSMSCHQLRSVHPQRPL